MDLGLRAFYLRWLKAATAGATECLRPGEADDLDTSRRAKLTRAHAQELDQLAAAVERVDDRPGAVER
jgi:hypothetical protein